METKTKRYIRAITYLLVEKMGIVTSVLGAMLFLGGPYLINQGKIPETSGNIVILIIATITTGSISVGLFFLSKRLEVLWENKM